MLLASTFVERPALASSANRFLITASGRARFFAIVPGPPGFSVVEIDPGNVEEVKNMLRNRGLSKIELQAIEVEHWSEHPLLQQQYDVIVCSHVLEHLPDPIKFLGKINSCLSPGGKFIGLVPLNERRLDIHHVQAIGQAKGGELGKGCEHAGGRLH